MEDLPAGMEVYHQMRSSAFEHMLDSYHESKQGSANLARLPLFLMLGAFRIALEHIKMCALLFHTKVLDVYWPWWLVHFRNLEESKAIEATEQYREVMEMDLRYHHGGRVAYVFNDL